MNLRRTIKLLRKTRLRNLRDKKLNKSKPAFRQLLSEHQWCDLKNHLEAFPKALVRILKCKYIPFLAYDIHIDIRTKDKVSFWVVIPCRPAPYKSVSHLLFQEILSKLRGYAANY
jgi:hypothetical protein